MKQLVLVKINTNWADEMDMGCFAIFEKDAWTQYEKMAKEIFTKLKGKTMRVGIGSNQDMYFENLKDHKKHYKAEKISPKDAKYLMKTFKVKVNVLNAPETMDHSHSVNSFGNWILLDTVQMAEMLYDADGNKNRELNYYE